jgi:hypothetical protein
MSFENTQLTLASGYDTKNMVFSKPKDGSIPNSTVVFKRIAIGTRNPDGSMGELVLSTPRVYSFGLSPNTNMQTGKTDGYTLSLCLHNRDNPTKEEKDWVETFNKIVEHVKQYLVNHRDEFGKYDLEMSDLKKLNPLYYKKEKGVVVQGAGPVLYAKVLQNKKNDAITTPFCNENGEDIEPMSLLNKHCYATAAIKIESIFIGAKISLQVKVYEAEVKVIDNSVKRLLRKTQPSSGVVLESKADEDFSSSSAASSSSASSSNSDDDSVDGSDDDDEEPSKPTPPPVTSKPAPARRVISKKT